MGKQNGKANGKNNGNPTSTKLIAKQPNGHSISIPPLITHNPNRLLIGENKTRPIVNFYAVQIDTPEARSYISSQSRNPDEVISCFESLIADIKDIPDENIEGERSEKKEKRKRLGAYLERGYRRGRLFLSDERQRAAFAVMDALRTYDN